MQHKDKKTIFAWAMYDWANSAFATSVMAAFFPIFFKQFWSVGTDPVVSTARLGCANSIAGIAVALCAPILGAIADKGGSKKRFLFLFVTIGVVMTSFLNLVPKGEWALAIVVYIWAIVGFSGGNIFYDSLITSVASEEKMDSVSALGFALGYLGGGILFTVNVVMILKPEMFGFADAVSAVKFSFLTVSIWWAVFSIPIFLVIREPEGSRCESAVTAVKAGFVQIKKTFHEIRHLRVIFMFLVAYWFYIDGVGTVIRMALDYGMSIGFRFNDLILALLVTQFVGFPSSIVFGCLGERIGTKRAILIAIVVYLSICIGASFIKHKYEFYLLAVIIGLVQGGIQALSRSFYAKIIPIDKSAEYFGFYNMTGKFSVVIGPVFVGMVGLILKAAGLSGYMASRIGISSISLLFIIGGVLFYFVNEEKGREEREYLAEK